MVFCPNCKNEVGESKFCPNCGSKILKPEIDPQENNTMNFCPNCGNEVGGSKFCPNCGLKILKHEAEIPTSEIDVNTNNQYTSDADEKDTFDKIIDIDDKISGKMNGLFAKSKTANKILDKTVSFQSFRYKLYQNREYLENIEPVFIEVYDSIDDPFIKDILMLERIAMATTSSAVGIVASQIYTPTKDMPHDKAVMFYQNMVNRIVSEINQEKQNGTFDEETFYKNKTKQATLDNISVYSNDSKLTFCFTDLSKSEYFSQLNLSSMDSTPLYSSKSDFFSWLYGMDKYANELIKEGLDDILSHNLDLLRKKEIGSRERKYRILQDLNNKQFYVRAIISLDRYNNYDNNIAIVIALISLHKKTKELGVEYALNRIEYNESHMRIFFEEKGEKN